MAIYVILSCATCKDKAAIGLNPEHAEFNLIESGGRNIAGVKVCKSCAKATR